MADRSQTDLLPGLFAPPRLPWELIIDSVRDGVICVEDGLKVIYMNRALEELFEIKRANVIGNPVEFSADLQTLFDEATRARQEFGGMPASPFRKEFIFKSTRSGEIPVSATITEALHGEMRIQIGVVRDLSNLKQMEAALVQSRKVQAVGALAGGIAHDFNNILTALLSQLDLALDFADLPAPAREHVVHAQTSGRRAAELISRLQTFSRQTQTRTTTVDLAELIEQVILILRRSIDRGIQIKSPDIKPGTWLIKADASQVIQVVFNLCLNARDAMPSGGELVIGVKRVRRLKPDSAPGAGNQRWIQITVRDSGPGISPEVLERLFEPYFTTKPLGRGTGLGLSIAQSITQDQGGWIEAESQPEHGSSFHVFLPEASSDAPAGSTALHAFTSTETRALEGRESVMIVDDEEMVRLVMKAVLSYRGYKISEATDGEHMLKAIEDAPAPVDLILLDVDMPKLNGWAALTKLKELAPATRVILLSGGALETDEDKARERGADGFLAKPFKNEHLVELVRKTLDLAKSAKG